MRTNTLTAWAVMATVAVATAASLPVLAATTDITINDQNVFPESISSTRDGTLYIGGSATGRIYRVRPGQSQAEPWISREGGDFHFVLGVLADPKGRRLWVCDNDRDRKTASLKTFALDSGKKLGVYALPDGSLCNDIALRNGAAYITDTRNGRIFRLARGASDLSVWYSDASDPSLDGIVWSKDGKLYTNTYGTNHLIRIDVHKDGSAGQGTVLATSEPLFQPDGLRLAADGRMLMIEGQGRPDAGLKEGRLDEVVIHGDVATIKVLQSGFELPAAVTAVGHTAWVLESKFDYQRNVDLKGKDPGSFHAYAVLIPKAD